MVPRITRTTADFILASLVLIVVSCSSLRHDSDRSSVPESHCWNQLRSGMTYSQVDALLGPSDPGLKEELAAALIEERANSETAKASVPPELTIDRRGYSLAFKGGRLAAWRTN